MVNFPVMDDDPPELGDVMDFELEQEEDRRWIVLYPEDYDNVALDPEGNLGVMVDFEQTGEILRLAAQTIAALSHRDADGDDVIRDMIEALEDVADDV